MIFISKVPFSFLLPSQWVPTLIQKNLLPMQQILPFKSRVQFGRVLWSTEANRKSQKLFTFVNMVGKHGGVPIHLKLYESLPKDILGHEMTLLCSLYRA